MTAATTVRGEFLPDLRPHAVDWPEVHKCQQQDKNLHHIPVLILTSSAAGNAITTSFENPTAACVVKPGSLTGPGQLMEDFGLYRPGRNGTSRSTKHE